jgi:hypothetical protein
MLTYMCVLDWQGMGRINVSLGVPLLYLEIQCLFTKTFAPTFAAFLRTAGIAARRPMPFLTHHVGFFGGVVSPGTAVHAG